MVRPLSNEPYSAYPCRTAGTGLSLSTHTFPSSISFLDDATWMVEGTDLDGVIRQLERCAAASLQWANKNAVNFETSKTKTIPPPPAEGGTDSASAEPEQEARPPTSPGRPRAGWGSG